MHMYMLTQNLIFKKYVDQRAGNIPGNTMYIIFPNQFSKIIL